jgi:hypothetical protein
MTQESKELLLKDLCARLPYGVFCSMGLDYPLPLQRLFIDKLDGILLDFYEDGEDYQVYLSEVKPYLRLMTSMTDEEREEYQNIIIQHSANLESWHEVDFLNKHHLDYRGLIDKGLAIKVTKNNNPYEKEQKEK